MNKPCFGKQPVARSARCAAEESRETGIFRLDATEAPAWLRRKRLMILFGNNRAGRKFPQRNVHPAHMQREIDWERLEFCPFIIKGYGQAAERKITTKANPLKDGDAKSPAYRFWQTGSTVAGPPK